MMDEVVITGSAIVCALGNSKATAWEALLAGRSGIGTLNGFATIQGEVPLGARVSGLDPAGLKIPPRRARLLSLPSCMLLKCARDAYAEAGLDQLAPLPGEGIAFFAGMGMVDYEPEDLWPAVKKSQTDEGKLDVGKFYAEGYREIYPLEPLFLLNNIGFCQAAISLGIKGENAVFVDQADAGAQAIGEGFWAIREKRAKAVLVAGVSAKVSPFSLARTQLATASNLSHRPGAMSCRSIARAGSDLVPGEGCGALVLEPRSAALARGSPYTARISGYGLAREQAAASAAPTVRAIVKAAGGALARAGLSPLDIDLVIAHGAGSEQGDKNERRALDQLFSTGARCAALFCSKGSLGNCLAAAVALDMVLAVCILEEKVIPPTLNVAPAADGMAFNIITGQPQQVCPRRILINVRGWEGQCASFVVEACS